MRVLNRKIGVFLLALSLAPAAYAETEELGRAVGALSSPQTDIRLKAIKQIGDMGIKATEQPVRPLIRQLTDDNENVKLESIKALGKLKWKAQLASEPLIRMLKDDSPAIREAAKQSLTNIGTREGLRAVKEMEETQTDLSLSRSYTQPEEKPKEVKEETEADRQKKRYQEYVEKIKKMEEEQQKAAEAEKKKLVIERPEEATSKREYIRTDRYKIYRHN